MDYRVKKFFTNELMSWNATENGRKMPWKGEKNPYRIWLSEIILQQTRVGQGWDYYLKFIEKYPTVQHLAEAPEKEVFKLWEGLGYYSRCKNLIVSARYITKDLQGIFPHTYETLLQLKGVGPYTAAAIASFAYNLPNAVVDGNVYRILSRYFGINIPIDSNEGKKYFASLATSLLDRSQPAVYNQAIIDLGATICKPLPLCNVCPLQMKCFAFKTNTIFKYPLKEKKIIKKVRWFYYLVAEFNDQLLIRKRTAKDIWQNLHDMILMESEHEMSTEEIRRCDLFKKMTILNNHFEISELYQQQLTHQTIKARFIYLPLVELPSLEEYQLEKRSEISRLAFPKIITTYFEKSGVLL
ncbi:MAG: A/G-specific adenine glycosylase [Ferruginibacter sp.]